MSTGSTGSPSEDRLDSVRPSGLSAATTVVGVIGDPIIHSLSPRLHNAAFDELGLDWVSLGFAVPVGSAPEALVGIRALGIRGLSVTMPHKSSVAALVDRRTPLAERLGAVNCVSNQDGVLIGDSTDGPGLVASLRRGAGFDPDGARCLVVGAGGAARGVIAALADAGAEEVVVVNRTRSRAQSAAELAGPAGRVGEPQDASGCALVVNATPAGMETTKRDDALLTAGSAPAWMVDPALLGPGQLVVDLVYQPAVTPWMAAAKDHGSRVLNGLGMLVHQAALQIEWWTGYDAPVDVMWRSVGSNLPG
jgi:shikimate dehydrogenase